MKKPSYWITTSLVSCVLFVVASPVHAQTEISTCEEFQNINNNLDESYILTQDIDCNETESWSENFEPIATSGYFYGTLDGQGYSVDGIWVSGIDSYAGIFNSTDGGAVISNIGFTDVEITGGSFTGGVVGNNSGTIENVYVTGWVTSLDNYPGGLAGYNNGGTITNSYSLAGVVAVSGTYGAGLVAVNSGTITNSYAAGAVNASSPQGISASNSSGTITDTFWDTTTSGTSNSSGGTGKTTTQMKTQSTFINWDFTNVWGIDSTAEANSGYPYLRMQGPQVTNVTSTTADGLYGVGSTIIIDVTFSETVTSTGDVTVTLETGTADRTCTFTITSASSGSCTYTVQSGDATDDLTVNSVTGTIIADVTSYPLYDTSPKVNLADNETLIIETTVPTILLTSTVDQNTTTSEDFVAFTATFSEAVTGFAVDDITVDNGSVANFATINASTYTFSIVSTNSGNVTVDIAEETVQDTAGNDNTAATQYAFTYEQIVLVESVDVNEGTITIVYDNGETVVYTPFEDNYIHHYIISEDGTKVAVVGDGKLKIYSSAGLVSVKSISGTDLRKSETKVKIKQLYSSYETVVVLTPGKMLVWRLTDDGELKKKAKVTYENTATLPSISFKKNKKHIKLKFDNAEKLTWKLKSNGKLKAIE